jgi:rhodanese-related sulfurtransferase
MKKAQLWGLVLVAGLLMALAASCATGNNAPRIAPEKLKGWLDNPDVLIIDVRQPKDWQSSATKIKGALRLYPDDVKTWAPMLPKDKKIVLYCA